MASDELRLLGRRAGNYRREHCTNCGALRDPSRASARYATEVSWSSTGIFQRKSEHQRKSELTTFPVLRYGWSRKRWFKNPIHDVRRRQLDLKGKGEPVSARLIAGAPSAKDWSEPQSLRGLTAPGLIH